MSKRIATVSVGDIRAKKKPKKEQTPKNVYFSYLTNHQNVVWDLVKSGMKPKEIASTLCRNEGLRDTAVTAKQVANWLQYHKNSGQGSTYPVSFKNNNLRADVADSSRDSNCMFLYETFNQQLLRFIYLLGYAKAVNTAQKDGISLQEEEEEFIDDEESEEGEYLEQDLAGKYLRFFLHSEEKKICLFVEAGIRRTVEACPNPTDGFTNVKLDIKIPLPPDELLHFAGFPHASNLHNLDEIDESFLIPLPGRIKQAFTTTQFPNSKTPIWIVFSFELEDEVVETPQKVKIDLMDLLGMGDAKFL